MRRFRTVANIIAERLGNPKLEWGIYSQGIQSNHYGFHPFWGVDGSDVHDLVSKDDKGVVLLRDAQQVLVSLHFWFKSSKRKTHLAEMAKNEISHDFEEFLHSDYGVKRFASYLNKIDKNKKLFPNFYYYEDDEELIIRDMPRLLGYSTVKLTDEETSRVIEENIDKNNSYGTDHSILTPEKVEYIQRTLDEYCKLDEYRDRYL